MLSSILSTLAMLSVASALPLEFDELAQRSASATCKTYKSGYLAANVNGKAQITVGTTMEPEDSDPRRQLEVLHGQQQEPSRVLRRREEPAQDPVPGTS